MTTFLIALALLSPQGGKHKLMPGQGIDWKADWDEAIKEAGARNVPIMFTVHKDN
ncbi:MAG TPA: hypothetical protein VF950_02965 [Planctomycetota bacterium]